MKLGDDRLDLAEQAQHAAEEEDWVSGLDEDDEDVPAGQTRVGYPWGNSPEVLEELGINTISTDVAERHARAIASSDESKAEDDPHAGTGKYQYRPCQLMTTGQVARKLHMPVARLHRNFWRDKLGAFQYGDPDMGKGCKLNWPRENVKAYLEAQKEDA